MSGINTRNDRDLLLDAWRGASVLLVILSHAVEARFANDWAALQMAFVQSLPAAQNSFATYLNTALTDTLEYAGQLGVQFFFVISGYIITTLLVEDHRRRRLRALRAFYIRRVFRILPALWLFLLFVLAMTTLGYIDTTPQSFAQSLLFLCNTTLPKCSWSVGHLWSLAVEEQFYLVWPLLLACVAYRHVPRIAFALMAAFLIAAQLSLLFAHGWLNNGLCFACVAAGACYATSPALQAAIARSASQPVLGLTALILFARPAIPLYFHGQFRLFDLLTPALICFVMFGSFRYRMHLEARAAIRMLAKIGLVSYGLYLWQQPFLSRADSFLRPSFLEYAPLFVIFALLSYFLVEKPLMRLGRNLSKTGREPVGIEPGRITP
jgi:peptidoglycan/LPS O-acetylase OafA/YrhL